MIGLNVAKIALFHSVHPFAIHDRSESEVAKAPPEEKSGARVCAEAGALSHLDSSWIIGWWECLVFNCFGIKRCFIKRIFYRIYSSFPELMLSSRTYSHFEPI